MAETRRRFDRDFREGAVRLVEETGKPIAQIARDLGINGGTLANWVARDRRRHGGDGALSEDERAEPARRLRRPLSRAPRMIRGRPSGLKGRCRDRCATACGRP